jgi:predicted nucleic acid-binding protein
MAVYYLDTSALVKRYAREKGSNWVLNLTDPVIRHGLYTVRLTGPEMLAAFTRKVRTGELPASAARQAAADFRTDWGGQYRIIEVTPALAGRAMDLVEPHNLRGYDVVHLAAAMELQVVRLAMRLPAIIFVSGDENQLDAAESEGLATENPNLHV